MCEISKFKALKLNPLFVSLMDEDILHLYITSDV